MWGFGRMVSGMGKEKRFTLRERGKKLFGGKVRELVKFNFLV